MAHEPPSPTQIGAAPASAPRTALAPGSVLFGAYEILAELSSGGMGSVYRARHRSLGESRAIKIMRPEVAADPRGTELFLREARALLEVTHDAVSRCHDLLRDEHGRLYLVTELVEGPSLRELLRQRALTPEQALELARRIACGLDAVHARGVVHRDLSPENILLPMGDVTRAKIIDFGVARIADTASTALRFKGKLAYASPEQLGLFGGELDARSDLYSLGLVLAECLLGEPVCRERSILQAIHRRQQRIVLPRRIPRALRRWLAPLLAPDPAARIRSAAELIERTDAVMRKRQSRLSTASTAVVSALVGAAAIFVLQYWAPPAWTALWGARPEAPPARRLAPAVSTPAVAAGSVEALPASSGSAASGDDRRTGVRDDPEPPVDGATSPRPPDALASEQGDVRPQGTGASTPRNPGPGPVRTQDDADVDVSECSAENARTRASLLYAQGRPCEAVELLDACCPPSVRYCRDMSGVLRARCRQP